MSAIVLSIRVHNICQYADAEINVLAGLNAVTGPNGSGKTNLCRALVYGLTGLVDGLWGNQQTLQRDGTADPGWVEVRFLHNGAEYAVRRFSAPGVDFPDTVKDASGKDVATRRKTVDAFMEDVFGMPCRLMFQVCWARQGELAQLLVSPPALVSTLLSQVFDCSRLEKLRAVIKKQVDTIAVPPVECRERLARWTAELAGVPERAQLEKAVADARQRLECADSAERAFLREHGGDSETVQLWRNELELRRRELAERTEPEPDDEDRKLSDEREISTLGEVLEKLSALRDRELELQPLLSNGKARLKLLFDRLVSMSGTEATVKAELAKSDGDKCLFCGGGIADAEMYRSHVSEAFMYDPQALAGLQQEHDQLASSMSSAESELASIHAQQQVLKRLGKAMRRVGQSAERATLSARIEELERRIAAKSGGEERARQLMEMRRARDAELREAERLLAERDSRFAAATQMVEELQAQVEALDRATEARDALLEIRDAMSQSRAQARYLAGRVEALNRELERFMGMTGMPFSVRLDPQTRAFVFTTQSGHEHPAVHLSGAQRSMTAVALQMAMFAVMRPNMNLFVIDEPTEALDDANKRVMADMFARMNTMLPQVDGTVFVVTRDVPVIESCGNVIEVGGTEE